MTLAHPKIKPPPKAEERKKLKKFEFGFLIIQQDGKCGCGCGQKLDFSQPGMVIDEHLISLQDGGSNDLDNRALYRKECADEKTKKDMGTIAKGKRVRGETGQRARRSKRKAAGKKPLIQSRNNLGWKPDNYVSPLSKAGRKGNRDE